MTLRLAACLLAALCSSGLAAPLFEFPTANRALLEGRPQDFFMYVDRDFEGQKSKPWQGGQYGYVRGPSRSGDTIVYNQLHEGVDIKPLERDAVGNPLDDVLAAADGRVVYINNLPSASNYGRYVVLEHVWGGCPYYTLYAHLSTILATPEQMVKQGQPIAKMGFTGAGINRERSHLHFEIGIMASRNFNSWHNAHFREANKHGLYNGMNIVGTDPSRLLLEAARNPNLSMRQYISSLEPTYRIAVPASPYFDLIRMYPWLVPTGQPANPPAWAITFSRHGIPVKVEALPTPISAPYVMWVKEAGENYTRLTRGMISGVANAPRLSESGRRFVELLTWGPTAPVTPVGN